MKKLIKKYWKIMVVIVILGIFVLSWNNIPIQKRYRKYFMHWRGQRRGNVGT